MGASPDGVLADWYGRYVGTPESESDVYLGFALFFGGLGLGSVGLLVFLWSVAAAGPRPAFALREVAIVAASVGLPVFLLGVVVLLPRDRRMTALAALGLVVCLVAIGVFVSAYPQHWNVARTPDRSPVGVTIYALGLVAAVGATGAALVGHLVERAAPEERVVDAESESDAREPVTDEQVRRDIDEALSDADLTWGGVEPSETRRLELEGADPGEVETNLDDVAAETTRSEADVDDAVSSLRELQGRSVDETTSEETVDDQTAALTELRERQRAEATTEADDEGSALDRIKRLLGL